MTRESIGTNESRSWESRSTIGMTSQRMLRKKAVGFNVYPTNIVEVEDEDYWPEECKRKNKKS